MTKNYNAVREVKYVEKVVRSINPAWLREIRLLSKLSLREVAKKLGYSAASNDKIVDYYEQLLSNK